MLLRNWLAHPLTRGLDLDDPRTTLLRREIIRQKPFLLQIYQEWYRQICQALPKGAEPVLELGSGAGFLDEYVPGLFRSEIFYCEGVSAVLDAHQLPFSDGAFKGIAMTNVMHHLAKPEVFFTEAARCIRPGGVLAALEPWVTSWSRLVYRYLHHEPCDPECKEWRFDTTGPVSGANEALPWIIFHRDRARFECEFPEWRIEAVKPTMPFRYLLSGGVSMRSLAPRWSYGMVSSLENLLLPWMDNLGMFAWIFLRRTSTNHPGEQQTEKGSL